MKFLLLALVALFSACGSSASNSLTASFVASPIKADQGAWSLVQPSGSGNVIALVTVFSDVDICATLASAVASPSTTPEPELLLLALSSGQSGVPPTGHYAVVDSNATASDANTARAAMTYTGKDGNSKYVANTGSVDLSAVPGSLTATSGTTSGALSATFTADTTLQQFARADASNSLSSSFSANYCAALTSLFQLAAGSDTSSSSTFESVLPHGLPALHRRIVEQFRVLQQAGAFGPSRN